MVILVSMLALSIQPHQEPRFLTPLLVPFIVIVANAGYLEVAGKLFWVSAMRSGVRKVVLDVDELF